jgi:hypothetical protein
MRFPRIRRARTLRKRLVHGLLVRLAVGLTVAALGTFFAVHTVLLNRLDGQLNSTAELLNTYAKTAPPGQLPDLATGSQNDHVWQLLSTTGLLPGFIQLRDSHNKVHFQLPSGRSDRGRSRTAP